MNIHDLYRPFLRYFRSKRMKNFLQRFELTAETRVLDIGGSLFNWLLIPNRPQLVVLNLSISRDKRLKNVTWLVADGCYLPFKDSVFDVVYSNSVIEHLENVQNQRLFAAECRRVGLRYYVQTPNKWFPIDPHLIAPFIHWLPWWIQKRLLRNFTVRGWITRPTEQESDDFLRGIRLLGPKELRHLFPDSEIWNERVLGFSKSLIAVKLNAKKLG